MHVFVQVCGEVGIRGYPTLKYFKRTGGQGGEERGEKRGEMEVANYSGARSREALQAFVQTNLVSRKHGEQELQRGRAGQRASERESGSGSTSETRGAGICICMYVYMYIY